MPTHWLHSRRYLSLARCALIPRHGNITGFGAGCMPEFHPSAGAMTVACALPAVLGRGRNAAVRHGHPRRARALRPVERDARPRRGGHPAPSAAIGQLITRQQHGGEIASCQPPAAPAAPPRARRATEHPRVPSSSGRSNTRLPCIADRRAVIHIDRDSVSVLACSRPALRQAASGRESPATQRGTVSGFRGRRSLGEAERFGVGPAVVLGQDFADRAWPVGDGAVADLAVRNR